MVDKTIVQTYTTQNPAETEALASHIGLLLKGGEFIELVGDVGAGKTTFVRGLAHGIGSKDRVSSPTYTTTNVYRGRLEMHHIDLYRLEEPGLMSHSLMELAQDKSSVVVIEWPKLVEGILQMPAIRVEFSSSKEEERTLRISTPRSYGYLGAKL